MRAYKIQSFRYNRERKKVKFHEVNRRMGISPSNVMKFGKGGERGEAMGYPRYNRSEFSVPPMLTYVC